MKIMFLAVLALVCLVSGFAIADDDGTISSENAFDCFPEYGTDAYGDAYLTTIFARDNGFAGNSFDVSALTPLTIVGFDCNLEDPSTPCDIFVYYKVGTADGFELNSGAWTLLGTDNVVPAGSDLPTHVDVGGLYMGTGDTVGFCIVSSESNVEYTNGGPNTYTNTDMSITTFRGLASGWPPSSVFTYRAWNGTVHYVFGTALDCNTWGSIKLTF